MRPVLEKIREPVADFGLATQEQRDAAVTKALGFVPTEGDKVFACLSIHHSTPNEITGSFDRHMGSTKFCPLVSCFRHSCQQDLRDINIRIGKELKKILLGQGCVATDPVAIARITAGAEKRAADKKTTEGIRRNTLKILRDILSGPDVTITELFGPCEEIQPYSRWMQRCHLTSLFEKDDCIWCGQPTDSTIRPRDEWLEMDLKGLNFTTASVFKPGSSSRQKENVQQWKYLVAECDACPMTLDGTVRGMIAEEELAWRAKNEVDLATMGKAAWVQRLQGQHLKICRWLMREHLIQPVAAVSTGNKSLHIWFRNDGEYIREQLVWMGLDGQVLRSVQPVRLAGTKREEKGTWQELLWIKKVSLT